MLDIRKLKELIRLMVENELTEIDLKDEKETVSLRREGSQAPVVQVSPARLPLRRQPQRQQHQPHLPLLHPPAPSRSSGPSRSSCRRALSSRHIQLGANHQPDGWDVLLLRGQARISSVCQRG